MIMMVPLFFDDEYGGYDGRPILYEPIFDEEIGSQFDDLEFLSGYRGKPTFDETFGDIFLVVEYNESPLKFALATSLCSPGGFMKISSGLECVFVLSFVVVPSVQKFSDDIIILWLHEFKDAPARL